MTPDEAEIISYLSYLKHMVCGSWAAIVGVISRTDMIGGAREFQSSARRGNRLLGLPATNAISLVTRSIE